MKVQPLPDSLSDGGAQFGEQSGDAAEGQGKLHFLPIDRSLLPIRLVAMLIGLYHRLGVRRNLRNVLWFSWSAFTFLLNLFVVLRLNEVLENGPLVLGINMNFVLVLLTAATAVSSLMCYLLFSVGCWKSKGIHYHISKWQKMIDGQKILLTRRFKINLAIHYIVFASAFLAYMVYNWRKIEIKSMREKWTRFNSNLTTLIVFGEILSYVILDIMLHFLPCFLCSVSLLWMEQFKQLSEKCFAVKQQLGFNCKKNSDQVEPFEKCEQKYELEEIRENFEESIQLLESFDKFIGKLGGMVISLSLPIVCLLIMFTKVEKCISMSSMYSHIIVFVLQSSVPAVYFSLMNDQIHAALDHLYAITPRLLNADDKSQLHLFINRLSTSSIGFSFFGMFVLDKSTLLTLLGTFITYILIIVQFPATETTCNGIPSNKLLNLTTPAPMQ